MEVALEPQSLRLSLSTGEDLWWPYNRIRIQASSFSKGITRIETLGDFPEILEISNPDFPKALQEKIPKDQWNRSRRRPKNLLPTMIVAAALLAGAVYSFSHWGIPRVSDWAARRVSVEWELKLGETLLLNVAPESRRCNSAAVQEAMAQALDRLTKAGAALPYDIELVFLKSPLVNAVALPGGKIIVFQGLLKELEDGDELGAVLSHEIQHIEQKHSLQSVFRALSFGVIIGVFSSESTQMQELLQAAVSLGIMGFSRKDEKEADLGAMETLGRAGIDPWSMVRLLKILDNSVPEGSTSLQYFSTHPPSKNRIADMSLLAAQNTLESRPLFTDSQWRKIKKLCQ